jgi:hypothetical protein
VYRPDGPFTEAARVVLHRHELDEVFAMNRLLFDAFGMSAVEQARTAQAIFLEAWMRAPATLAMLSLTRLNATLLGIVFDPVRTLGAIGQIAGRDWILLASLTRAVRLAGRGDIGAMLIAVATVLSRAIAAAVWAAAGWAVLRALRSPRNSLPHPEKVLALALFVLAWTGLCLPFRVNDRYLSPIIPPLLALAALALSPARAATSAIRSPGPSGILRSPSP